MEILGFLFIAIGGILAVAGGLWFLLVTFQEGLGWGLACLFIPFAALIFLVMHWEEAGKPFLLQLAGIVPLFIGLALMNGGAQ